MPRIIITTTAQATVTEEWVLDISAQDLARLQADELTLTTGQYGERITEEMVADELIDNGGTYVDVTNVAVEDEHDRTATSWQVVADDYVTAPPSVGL